MCCGLTNYTEYASKSVELWDWPSCFNVVDGLYVLNAVSDYRY